jgi:hypothetical protein
MGVLARDTDKTAERAQIAILKSLPAWRKLELLDDACVTTRTMVTAGLRFRYPNLSNPDLHRMLMDVLVGEETAERIWGPRTQSGR